MSACPVVGQLSGSVHRKNFPSRSSGAPHEVHCVGIPTFCGFESGVGVTVVVEVDLDVDMEWCFDMLRDDRIFFEPFGA